MYDLENKRKRIELFAKIGIALVISFLVAPFIFLTIQGLVGLIIAGGIAFGAIQFMPYFAAKIGNWRLKALKHEAAKNPIETLETDFQRKRQNLIDYRESIRSFAGNVGVFTNKTEDFKKQYPSEAAKFDEQLAQMYQLLDMRKQKYEDAKVNLVAYEQEINKARAMWEMAKAAAEMNKLAGVDADAFLHKIQSETALDSVQKGLSSAFADLEISLLDEEKKPAPKALPAADEKKAIEVKSSTKSKTKSVATKGKSDLDLDC